MISAIFYTLCLIGYIVTQLIVNKNHRKKMDKILALRNHQFKKMNEDHVKIVNAFFKDLNNG